MRAEIAYRQEAARHFATDQRRAALARCCQAGADLLALARGLAGRLTRRDNSETTCCTA